MSHDNFEKSFDYGSFFPTFILILGFYIIYLLVNSNNSQAFFAMMIAFLVYIGNNVIINVTGFSTVFNEYFEDMASFLAFGVTTIIFGFIFFKENLLVLTIIFFYAVSLVLALARNWILKLKNSLGWPIALNGIFFPLIYYVYIFYLQGPGSSIFIIYFIFIGIMSVSKFNFLGYSEVTTEKFKVVDSDVYEKYKDNFDKNPEKNFKGENGEEIVDYGNDLDDEISNNEDVVDKKTLTNKEEISTEKKEMNKENMINKSSLDKVLDGMNSNLEK